MKGHISPAPLVHIGTSRDFAAGIENMESNLVHISSVVPSRGLVFCMVQLLTKNKKKKICTSWILQTKGFIWESSVCAVLPFEDALIIRWVTIIGKLELRPLALLWVWNFCTEKQEWAAQEFVISIKRLK